MFLVTNRSIDTKRMPESRTEHSTVDSPSSMADERVFFSSVDKLDRFSSKNEHDVAEEKMYESPGDHGRRCDASGWNQENETSSFNYMSSESLPSVSDLFDLKQADLNTLLLGNNHNKSGSRNQARHHHNVSVCYCRSVLVESC